eukprot:5893605-Prorocentrum_lima.AAC.1
MRRDCVQPEVREIRRNFSLPVEPEVDTYSAWRSRIAERIVAHCHRKARDGHVPNPALASTLPAP